MHNKKVTGKNMPRRTVYSHLNQVALVTGYAYRFRHEICCGRFEKQGEYKYYTMGGKICTRFAGIIRPQDMGSGDTILDKGNYISDLQKVVQKID